MRISDWSSDVCSSDLGVVTEPARGNLAQGIARRRGEIDGESGEIVRRHLASGQYHARSEERRVGKECVRRVDLGGRRIIKKKKKETIENIENNNNQIQNTIIKENQSMQNTLTT